MTQPVAAPAGLCYLPHGAHRLIPVGVFVCGVKCRSARLFEGAVAGKFVQIARYPRLFPRQEALDRSRKGRVREPVGDRKSVV